MKKDQWVFVSMVALGSVFVALLERDFGQFVAYFFGVAVGVVAARVSLEVAMAAEV